MSGIDFSDKETNVNSNNPRDYANKIINDDNHPIHFNKDYDSNPDKHLLHTSPQDNSNLNPTEQMEQKNTKENSNSNFIQLNDKTNNNTSNMQNNNNNLRQIKEQQEQNFPIEGEDECTEEEEKSENTETQQALNTHFYDNYIERLKLERLEKNSNNNKIVRHKSFANKKYNGRIDPVQLNKKYNEYWDKNKNKCKKNYKNKMKNLQKVFHPKGYDMYSKTNRNFNKSKKSIYTESYYDEDEISKKPPFDNSKQPLPKKSYLYYPYDHGLNDPKYGIENPQYYNRMKMVKLHMIKQPLKYYFPYTDNFVNNNKKYE